MALAVWRDYARSYGICLLAAFIAGCVLSLTPLSFWQAVAFACGGVVGGAIGAAPVTAYIAWDERRFMRASGGHSG
ncbi:hypothetical protein [Prescottella equi]|uniref:hypothetical protein n=1 Tax=Rhodococcus hoagii TaxID=43767 RepID=UPI001584F44C|nr:hypothetical protein [Prescottella equi]